VVYIHWSVSKWAQIAHTGLANEFTIEASGKRRFFNGLLVFSHITAAVRHVTSPTIHFKTQ
jgi:hypothetical protein